MVSLARATLRYEWKRYLAAVLAVAFSGLLTLVQLGLLLGMFGTVSAVIDNTRADLWAGFPNTPSFDLGRSISRRNEALLLAHPEVVAVERFLMGYGDWRKPDGSPESTVIVGVDLRENGLGLPISVPANLRLAMEEPGAVLVDRAELGKLKTHKGQSIEINGKQAKVVGLISGFRNIGGPYVFCSLSTAQKLLGTIGMETDLTTYLLIRLRDPRRAEAVRHQLQAQDDHPPFMVWTAKEFSQQSQVYWLLESGVGAGFGFSSLLGLMVGIVITSQTLMSAINASLREYATLRALGVSLWSLCAVVLEQSFWVGLLGLTLTAIATAGVWMLAHTYHVAINFPLWAMLGTALMTLVIAIGSGLLALRALFKAEPAELLR
ncbi:MAG: hypothetical protein HY231_11310 [Acidobacteria bacterium]|nr:hypothetical protein [Acidobacteriota bacterium]